MIWLKLSRLIVLIAIFGSHLPCLFWTSEAFSEAAPEIKTEKLSANILYCRLVRYNARDPMGFVAEIGSAQPGPKVFDSLKDVGLGLIILIRRLEAAVPVEWVVVWGEEQAGYAAGVTYGGMIPKNASPKGIAARYYVEDAKGNRMTLFPLMSRPNEPRYQRRGQFFAMLHSLEIDGRSIEYPCRWDFSVE